MTEPIRSYPIMVSPPLWPERDVCCYCSREKLSDEEPWPDRDCCPDCYDRYFRLEEEDLP